MASESPWEHFFKPEVRKAGADLIRKDTVFLQRGSDTQVSASVRASPPVKVRFASDSISSPDFTVDCTCSASKKGQLCKHIWATLLLVTEKSPDFLDSKKSIEKMSAEEKSTAPTPDRAPSASQMDYKKKQANYRKEAYQAQKLRAKNFRASSKEKDPAPSKTTVPMSSQVQAALSYFESNGFPLSPPFTEENVGQAKRVLSRVFHPDKGGTHEEMVELLRHCEALLT